MAHSLVDMVKAAIEVSSRQRTPSELHAATQWLHNFQRSGEAWSALLQLIHQETGATQLMATTLFLGKLRSENLSLQAPEIQQGVTAGLSSILASILNGSRDDVLSSPASLEKFATVMAICAAQRGREANEGYVSSLLQLARTPGQNGLAQERNVRIAIEMLDRVARLKVTTSPLTPFLPAVLALLEFASLGQQLDESTTAQLALHPFPIDALSGARDSWGSALVFRCLRELPLVGVRLHSLQMSRPGLLLALLSHIADPVDTAPSLASTGGGGLVAFSSTNSLASMSSGSLSSLGLSPVAGPQGLSTARRAKACIRSAFACAVEALDETDSLLSWADSDLRVGRAGARRGVYLAARVGVDRSDEEDGGGPNRELGVRLSPDEVNATLSALRSIHCAVARGFDVMRMLRGGRSPVGKVVTVPSRQGWGFISDMVWKDVLEKLASIALRLVSASAETACSTATHVDALFGDLIVECAGTATCLTVVRYACTIATKIALVPAAKRTEVYRASLFTRISNMLFDSCRYPTTFPSSGEWQVWLSSHEGLPYHMDEREWEDARRGPFAQAMDACFGALGAEFLRLLLDCCPLSGAAPHPPADMSQDSDVECGSATPKACRVWGAMDPAGPGAWQRMELLLFVLNSIHSAMLARLRALDKLCGLAGADPCAVPAEAVARAPRELQSSISESVGITQLLRQVFTVIASAGPLVQASPLVAHAGCRLIGAYSPWLLSAAGNGELPGQCLAFVARAMATPATATAAASALASLVARAAPHIAGHPDLPRHLVGSYAAAYPHLPLDARRNAGGALVRVASQLPNFADAAGMIMVVARSSLNELEACVERSKAKAVVRETGGRAQVRAAFRTGTMERIAQDLARPLDVLAGIVVLASKSPHLGHPPIVLSPGQPPVPAQHCALMVLDAVRPAMQDLLAPSASAGGLGDFLRGSDVVYSSLSAFLVDVARPVAEFPADAPHAFGVLLASLRAAFRSTIEPCFLTGIGSLARETGTVLGRMLDSAERSSEGKGLSLSPAYPVYNAFTSTAREALLLCCHLFMRNAYGTVREGVSTDVEGASRPPHHFCRMYRDGGGFDCGLLLTASFNMCAAMACTVPVALLGEGMDDEAAAAAARMIQTRMIREDDGLLPDGGPWAPGTAAAAAATPEAIAHAAGAHASAVVTAYNVPLPQLLGLLLDHGISMLSELDRQEKPAILGLLSALHRLRFSLSARLSLQEVGAGLGAPHPSGQAQGSIGKGSGGIAALAHSQSSSAFAFADSALSTLAQGEDLSARGATTALSFLAPVSLRTLPLAMVGPLWQVTERVVGARARDTITVLLACAMLQKGEGSGLAESQLKEATTLAIAAHGVFASACLQGDLSGHGYASTTPTSSVPCHVAYASMVGYLTSCVGTACEAAQRGQASNAAYMLAAFGGGGGAGEGVEGGAEDAGRVSIQRLSAPAVTQRVGAALTRAIFGHCNRQASDAQQGMDTRASGPEAEALPGQASSSPPPTVGAVSLTERAAAVAGIMVMLSVEAQTGGGGNGFTQ